jgi:hypothetical protein
MPTELELAALQQVIVELQQTVLALRTSAHQRAEPSALALIDTLDVWCNMAEEPSHPSATKARELIKRFMVTMERLRAINAGIALPGRLVN